MFQSPEVFLAFYLALVSFPFLIPVVHAAIDVLRSVIHAVIRRPSTP